MRSARKRFVAGIAGRERSPSSGDESTRVETSWKPRTRAGDGDRSVCHALVAQKKGSPQAGMNEHKSAKCVLQDTAYTASPWHDYSPCVLAPAIQVPKVRQKRRVQHCHATFPLGLGRPSDPRLRGTGTTRSECCSDQSPCGRPPDARGQRCEGANEGGLLHRWHDQQPAFGSSFC
jgi:hypothetical protein